MTECDALSCVYGPNLEQYTNTSNIFAFHDDDLSTKFKPHIRFVTRNALPLQKVIVIT